MRKKVLSFLAVLVILTSLTVVIPGVLAVKNDKYAQSLLLGQSVDPYDIAKPLPSSTPTATPKPKTSTKVTQQPQKQELPVVSGAEVFRLVNEFRQQNGKPTLTVSDELCRIAEGRADYMMQGKMDNFKSSESGAHTGFDDAANNYSGTGVGENLAANVASAKITVDLWKQSTKGHRELMLLTERDGAQLDSACVATRVQEKGSIVVFLIGDV